MTDREQFEAAWRKEYPLHGTTTFMRSKLNPEAYVNTRVQDGWLMWQAALLSASKPAAPKYDARDPGNWRDGDDACGNDAAPAQSAEPEPGTTEYGSWINKAKREVDQRFAFHREPFKYLCAFQQELRKIVAAPQPSPTAVDVVPSMTNGDFHCPACGNVMKGPTSCGSCLWEAETCGYKAAVVLDERAAFEAWFEQNKGHSHGWSPRYAAIEGWQARAASSQPVKQTTGSWETSSISNELWQLADQCGYEQFRDAVTAHIKQAYQDGWTDRGKGISSVTYGDQK
jgi:hypothetical protein